MKTKYNCGQERFGDGWHNRDCPAVNQPDNSAETIARLIAERDAAHEKYMGRLGRNAELELERDALQEQVKNLCDLLSDACDALDNQHVYSKHFKEALATAEQNCNSTEE